MARPKRGKPPGAAGAIDPEAVAAADERQFRWLGRWMLTGEPDSLGETVGSAIRNEKDRLERRDELTDRERIAALLRFIATKGSPALAERAAAWSERFRQGVGTAADRTR